MPTNIPAAVFLLIGQSNMNGYTRYAVPPEPQDGGVAVWTGEWSYIAAPPGPSLGMKGPSLAFGRAYVARTGQTVGFVNGARGGSSIREWQKGEPLYQNVLANLAGSGGPLAGVLVWQGEEDALPAGTLDASGYPVNPATWGQQFAQLVTDLRADTGHPRLRVLVARLARTTDPAMVNWGVVQAQQDAIGIAGVTLIATEPASLIDGLHMDDQGAAVVGRRMEAAWWAGP